MQSQDFFFTSNAYTKTGLQNVVAKRGRNKNTFCQFHQHFTKNIYPNFLFQKNTNAHRTEVQKKNFGSAHKM